MLLLILGLAFWYGAHFFKRVAPARRAAMGDSAKGLVALGIVIGIVLMVIGYRSVEPVYLWFSPPFMIHINNLMVLVAIYMASPAPQRGAILNGVRHPMLIGFCLWAVAHLLVNGELADLILFGGLLVWAVLEIIVINRAEPDWQPRPQGSIAKDAMFFVGSIVLVGVIGWIHSLVGPWPFPI